MIDLIKDLNEIREDIFLQPYVCLYAVGGFPIKRNKNNFYLLNKKITLETLKIDINEALGLSGVMTFNNKSNLTLTELGNICLKHKHTWAYNWITLSILIVTNSEKVEKTFLRSNKFYESWTVDSKQHIFGITGSIKNIIKFIKNKDDISFDVESRNIMKLIDKNYSFLWT